jgi:hypothetical protein
LELSKTLEYWKDHFVKGKTHVAYGLSYIVESVAEIHDGELWRKECDSFEQFVEGEFGIKRSQAYNYVKLWGQFKPFLLKDRSAPITRLIEASTVVTDENKEDIYHSAVSIPTAPGWDNQLRMWKGKPQTDACSHTWSPVRWIKCTLCPAMRREDD